MTARRWALSSELWKAWVGRIYDQVGGGFHRYSVDEEWLTPHFEKMLYNQAQLGMVYLQAYQLTGGFFARVARQTCNYVLRDMQIEQGGYYSATDADSEGEEGTFLPGARANWKNVCRRPRRNWLRACSASVRVGILRAPIFCIYPAPYRCLLENTDRISIAIWMPY